MAQEERQGCMKCGLRVISDHLRRLALPVGELRFCIQCSQDFWDWLASRRLHTDREAASDRTTGLSVSLCLICRCELDRWLKPLYPAPPG